MTRKLGDVRGKWCPKIKYQFGTRPGTDCIHRDEFNRCKLHPRKKDGSYPSCEAEVRK